MTKTKIQCEGMRRYGAFNLGGAARWQQCKSPATVQMTWTQEGNTETFPACNHCRDESNSTDGIEVIEVKPINGKDRP